MNTTTTIYAKHEPEKPHEKKSEPVAAEKKAASETKNERILRILTTTRERLQGLGTPELDVEVDELIAEVKTWGK